MQDLLGSGASASVCRAQDTLADVVGDVGGEASEVAIKLMLPMLAPACHTRLTS